MTDSQEHRKLPQLTLAGQQPQGATNETTATRSTVGGLVQEFELSPRGAGTPDKFATPSTLLDSSQTSPPRTDSRATSPGLGVRVTSPRSGKEALSLVTDAALDKRIEQLTLAIHAHMVRAIQEEITSFDSTLQGSFDALEARCEALEKMGGGHAQELERHEHDHRALADRVDELQRQSAEQDPLVAQLGHTGGQALDSLLGPRLDKISQDHQESVRALELANQQMVVRLETLQEQSSMLFDAHKAQEQGFKALDSLTCFAKTVETELQRLEGMLHSPAPSIESDLQKFFQEMEDLKDKLHSLSHAQIQDHNDLEKVNQSDLQKFFQEMEDLKDKLHTLSHAQIQDHNDLEKVNHFQKELGRRVDEETKLLRGKVDEVTHMVQEDLMGLGSKLCTDLENLQADREAAPNAFDSPGSGIGANIVVERLVLEEAADDDCRWELQLRALEIEAAPSKAHLEVTEAEHNEQPPEFICGDPPPLASGSLTARREPKGASVFQHTLPAEVTSDSEPPPSPQPTTLGLAELQRKVDQKLDMSLRQVDEFITRHEAKLQQLGEVLEVGNQFSLVQQCVEDLRGEIVSVRGDLDALRSDKVLKHMRNISSLFGAGKPGGMTAYTEV